MELRKDPITRSWVVTGHREVYEAPASCPICTAAANSAGLLLRLPADGPWKVCVFPHFDPLYRIEGEIGRSPEGIYDKMRAVGAHEIVVETPEHNVPLRELGDEQIEMVLQAFASRILDLKKDLRFKYITVFKDTGPLAAEDWGHAHAQITATTFVPRRVLYELRAARDYFHQKERCVFCDIVRQEERKGTRVVDSQGDYVAFCPYASRVPFEVWVVSRKHNHQFESPRPGAQRKNLAILMGRMVRRLSQIAENYHMVLHTSPNLLQTKGELSEYWRTIAEDYHWHIEILPMLERRSKSYTFKEVYFNAMPPEESAARLREIDLKP